MGSATWNQWEYVDGQFVLRQYGLQVTGEPMLTPNSRSAVCTDGVWEMKSGYGFSLTWEPMISRLSGFYMPTENAYTCLQKATAAFQEYEYSMENGKHRTMEMIENTFQFPENSDASGERIHFIPVFIANGDYFVSVTVTQFWTPAGMITVNRNCCIKINGSLYDEFFVGHR